jgi:predicted MFS family arabinose efflux permease
MHTRKQFLLQAAPLLLVLFIDSMGLGLVIPIINGLLFDPHSQFLSAKLNTPFMHNVIYGLVLAVFMLCWFFGSSVLGDLSDKIGRKRSLQICLSGATLSYLLAALAVNSCSISLLLLSRMVSGLTAGSQPIAQAAIVDISHPEHKTRNMSYMLLTLSLGFVFGPLLGGLLSDNHLVSWFSFAMPFYFAASLSLLNVLMLSVWFTETHQTTKGKLKLNPAYAVSILIQAFQHEKVRRVGILYLLFIFGWSSFYSFISAFLMKDYHFTPTDISIYMAVMGLGFGIGNGFLVEFLTKRFNVIQLFMYSCVVAAISALLIALIPHVLAAWLLVIPIASAVSSAYAAVLTLFSNQVDHSRQGWVMGVSGSIMALDWAINSVIMGVASNFDAVLPLYFSFGGLLLAVIFSLVCKSQVIIKSRPTSKILAH